MLDMLLCGCEGGGSAEVVVSLMLMVDGLIILVCVGCCDQNTLQKMDIKILY